MYNLVLKIHKKIVILKLLPRYFDWEIMSTYTFVDPVDVELILHCVEKHVIIFYANIIHISYSWFLSLLYSL